MESTVAIVSSEESLRRLADGRTFERGQAYWQAGRVGSPRGDGGAIIATVAGGQDYRVRLWREDNELAWSCTCPVGETGVFCKHTVAVGLAVLAGGPGGEPGALPTVDDLRTWLLRKDTAELVEMLLEQARDDDQLLRRLTLGAARERSTGVDLDVWRRALDDAIRHADDIGYAEARAYVAGIGEVLDSLDGLLADGHAGAVVTLADHAIDALIEALNGIDDSNGGGGGLLHRLKTLHLAACRKAGPDPEDLAEQLFEREAGDARDVFYGCAAAYADVLGERGLAMFRRLAEVEWALVPALGPGGHDPDLYGRRYRIRSIMLALADDIDAEVAVMARDLSTPYAFLEIARRYQDAGRADTALEWAERGWQAFTGSRQDDRLRSFLADAWHERGRHDEAMALVWEGFAAVPGFDGYKNLKAHAARGGRWPEWRDKALARIRERFAGVRSPRPSLAMWGDHSDLVDIFLWEGDDESAWREAQAGGCSGQRWLQLAERRAAMHPEDALAIYRAQLPAVLPETGSGDYDRAIGFLHHIRTLLTALGRAGEFSRLTAELRAQHRRKRNFVALLNREGW